MSLSTNLRTSRRFRFAVPLLVLAASFALGACGDDDDPMGPDGVEISDLAGTWSATQFEWVPAAGGVGVDLTDLGSAAIVVESNGDYELTALVPGEGTLVSTGTISFDPEDEDFLIITTDGEPGEEEFFFTLSGDGDTMTLFSGDSAYDFDGDGTDEPASLEITFQRV